MIDNDVPVRCIEFRQHTGGRRCQFTNIDQHAVFHWNPGTIGTWLEFLLDPDLLDKIKIRLFADGGVYLLQCPMFFRNPCRSGECEILRTLWMKIEAITIVVADKKAVRQVVIVIQSPAISNRRNEFLRENVKPV